MSKELVFANENKALQHLANITGKQIKIASTFSYDDIDVVVSRHAGAIKWIAHNLSTADTSVELEDDKYIVKKDGNKIKEIPIITGNATVGEISNKRVLGNLPLQLAAEAKEVVAVEFKGAPPRGSEYGINEMSEAGAKLARYKVQKI